MNVWYNGENFHFKFLLKMKKVTKMIRKLLYFIIRWFVFPRLIYRKPENPQIQELFSRYSVCTWWVCLRKYYVLNDVNAAPGVTEEVLSMLVNEEKALPTKDKKLLNVACGIKKQMNFLQDLGFNAYGIDLDIKQDSEFVKYHDLNLETPIPFPEKYFDYTVCQEIIEHLENPWLLFRKVNRVLKIDGVLIVSTPNICSIDAKIRFFQSTYGYNRWFTPEESWEHINPIPYWEMLHIARYNGFELEGLSGDFYHFASPKFLFPVSAEKREADIIHSNNVLIFKFKKIADHTSTYIPESPAAHNL